MNKLVNFKIWHLLLNRLLLSVEPEGQITGQEGNFFDKGMEKSPRALSLCTIANLVPQGLWAA